MKIRVDVDCTPEEARRFLGLPDVSALNDAFVAEAQKKMQSVFADMDGESLMKTWLGSAMPGGAGSGHPMGDWGEIQKRFWGQMFGGVSGTHGDADKPDPSDKKTRKGD